MNHDAVGTSLPPTARFAQPVAIPRRRALGVAAGFALGGCGPSLHASSALRIGMVTDYGGLGDHSFNDSANAGLQAAHRRFGFTPVVLQSRSVNDYQLNLMALANEDCREIFAIGYDEALDLGEVARRFPRQHFSIVDAAVDAPNVTSVRFRAAEGSFLAGALAAACSTTHTIGFLGGADVPIIAAFETGYAAGMRQFDAGTKLLVKYVGSFDDVAAGKELAGTLFDAGADIVYTAAGKAGLGAIDQVRGRRAYVIGVDSDQDALAPGKILTSVLKRIDVSVYRLCALAAAGARRPQQLLLGLREGAVGLTAFRFTAGIVTPSRRRMLARLQAAVIDGTVVVPTTRVALAAFRPIKL